MTAAQAPEMTPVQDAFIALHQHGLKCPQCAPVWSGDKATFGECPEADRLYREWRQLDRERRQI